MWLMGRQLHKAAERFLQAEAPAAGVAELPDLLWRTAEHLRERFPSVMPNVASEAALAAWSEIEGRRSRCYVDLKTSTEHLLFLVDPVAGTRRPIPVVDLVRLLGPRAAAA